MFVSPGGFGNALEGVACDDLKMHAFQTIRGAAPTALDARFAALPMEILGGSLGSKEPRFLETNVNGHSFQGAFVTSVPSQGLRAVGVGSS